MLSRRTLLASATATAAVTATTSAPHAVAAPAAPQESSEGPDGLRVASLTTEYAEQPLGLDAPTPRLSWRLSSQTAGCLQAAYQIRVATSADPTDEADVWDSGRVESRSSVLVPYDGPALQPRTRYHWTVRVWDEDGRESGWAKPTWWETGLFDDEEWQAPWITAPPALVTAPSFEGASWLWFPEDAAADQLPQGKRYFRGAFDVASRPSRALLALAVDDGCTAWLNGTEVVYHEPLANRNNYANPALVDVTRELREGHNVLAVEAVNAEEGTAGLLAVVEGTAQGEQTLQVRTDDTWRTTDTAPDGDAWRAPDFDDSAWQTAEKVGAWGDEPWGKVKAPLSPAQLRREFRVRGEVARARLHATALGLYEAHLNGERVGTDLLTPGWTDYNYRVAYQTYDVTKAVQRGENALGITLAPGWYAGNVSSFGTEKYGKNPALRVQLEIDYADGSTERVHTDADWRAGLGPLVTADLVMGEDYDGRRSTEGWTSPGFDASGWQPVVAADEIDVPVVHTAEEPTRAVRELEPVEVVETSPGVHRFDLGQNMVGVVRLRVSGAEAGQRLRLRHGEVLDQDGELYVANLRSARAVDTFVLRGEGEEVCTPRFTFHGFRYVEVVGYPGTPPKDAVTGVVLHTDAPMTMEFATDNAVLNQLHSNITWGQRGNFLAVPTDTPARDERLGWSGDINVFGPTACYVMDSASFLTKWLRDLRDGQPTEGEDAGAFPDVAPWLDEVGNGAAGWGDAGVTVPWALYQAYGDRRVLRENWAAIQAWLAYLEAHSEDLVRPDSGYGDWLNIDDETPKDLVGTAYFAHVAELAAQIAEVLDEDAAPYRDLHERVRDAFVTTYVHDDGTIGEDTQTGYVLALSMELLPSKTVQRAAATRLVELIEAADDHLSTGFLGTPRLLPALTDAGHMDVAYRLLRQDTFPSWGYQIDKGATTMWERWDSIKPDGSFQDVGMNSFNHYAYGCVGEWMYRHLAGIAPAAPGYAKVLVAPRPGGGVQSASGRFTSPYGQIATRWTQSDAEFTLDVELPANTTAEIRVPGDDAEVGQGEARLTRRSDGATWFAAGSGRHRFRTARR